MDPCIGSKRKIVFLFSFFRSTQKERTKHCRFVVKTYNAALRADYDSYFNLGVSNL